MPKHTTTNFFPIIDITQGEQSKAIVVTIPQKLLNLYVNEQYREIDDLTTGIKNLWGEVSDDTVVDVKLVSTLSDGNRKLSIVVTTKNENCEEKLFVANLLDVEETPADVIMHDMEFVEFYNEDISFPNDDSIWMKVKNYPVAILSFVQQ